VKVSAYFWQINLFVYDIDFVAVMKELIPALVAAIEVIRITAVNSVHGSDKVIFACLQNTPIKLWKQDIAIKCEFTFDSLLL